MTLQRIRFDQIVKCHRCGWLLPFGKGFWSELPAFRNYRGWVERRKVVLCSCCYQFNMSAAAGIPRPLLLSLPRIEDTVIETVNGRSEGWE